MTGEEFRLERERLGIPKLRMAEAMGVTPTTVTNWENRDELPRYVGLALAAHLAGLRPRGDEA